MNTFLSNISMTKNKERYFIVIGSIGLIAVLFLSWYMLNTFGKIVKVDQSLQKKYQRFSLYQDGVQNYPSPERKEFLQNQQKKLQKLISGLREYPIFADRLIASDMLTVSPLKFKEELFRVKKELRRLADKKGVSITNVIGLEYWEENIPKRSELETLFRQLKKIREIGVIAINAAIKDIKVMTIFELKEHTHVSELNNEKYYESEIQMTVTGAPWSIFDFIYELSRSEMLFHVKNVKVYIPEQSKSEKRGKSSESKDEALARNEITAEMVIVSTTL